MLWPNSDNTYFGHFLVENQDTRRKKSFCNSVVSKSASVALVKIEKDKLCLECHTRWYKLSLIEEKLVYKLNLIAGKKNIGFINFA